MSDTARPPPPVAPPPLALSLEPLLKNPTYEPLVRLFQAAPSPLSIEDVHTALPEVSRRTLQRRLAELAVIGVLLRSGAKRGVRYTLHRESETAVASVPEATVVGSHQGLPLSTEGAQIRDAVNRPQASRLPVGYLPDFLADYEPNVSAYLPASVRDQLHAMGRPPNGQAPAGTFANDILDRLLIDLSFSSSRLEGNTYSLLDTRHLIERGEAAAGKDAVETQMILNHKDAIEFLVRDPSCATVNGGAIKSLHALLSDGLLADPTDVGRLRQRPVGIAGSVYLPLALGATVEEQFELLMAKASAIRDPFEQAFFLMVQLPYLQPFMDVNKRVSRLATNIPLVQANLCPLSFIDVPTDTYTDATLGVYELQRVEMLRDVFLFAYQRSCQQYAAAVQSLRPPDAFRVRYRPLLGQAIAGIVRAGDPATPASVRQHMPARVEAEDQERFVQLTLDEFRSLNPDNAVRFGVRPLEFLAWKGRTQA